MVTAEGLIGFALAICTLAGLFAITEMGRALVVRFFAPVLAVVLTLLGVAGALAVSDDGSDDVVTETQTVTQPVARVETQTVTVTGPRGGTDDPQATGSCVESSPGAPARRYEPNDRVDEAFGPISANRAYKAAIETDNDEDYFVFCVPEKTQLVIQARLLTCEDAAEGCANVFVDLVDTDGEERGEVGLYANGESRRIRYTAPAAGRYYLVASGDVSNVYDFKLTSTAGLTRRLSG